MGFVLFAAIVGAIFGYLSHTEQESKENMEALEKKDISTMSEYITKAERDSIINLIQVKDSIITARSHVKDSLEQVIQSNITSIDNYKQRVKDLESQIKKNTKRSENLKNIAKTYESLRVADLRPIVKKIGDTTLIGIYNKMSSRKRQKLLQALTPDRAAKLTNKLANNE